MLKQFILGLIQGIAEWLPVSSEGLIVLTLTNVFHSPNVELSIHQALNLHMGTLIAAVIYLRGDITGLFRREKTDGSTGRCQSNTLVFLGISTAISCGLGFVLVQALKHLEAEVLLTGKVLTFLIGCCLLITGGLLLKARTGGARDALSLSKKDALLLGIAQGFAALPGLSRSGLTIAALLFLKFEKTFAVRLSFLMSIPIVLAGNTYLMTKTLGNSEGALVSGHLSLAAVGVITALASGLLTIHLLLKATRRINFGGFMLVFGILTILSGLI